MVLYKVSVWHEIAQFSRTCQEFLLLPQLHIPLAAALSRVSCGVSAILGRRSAAAARRRCRRGRPPLPGPNAGERRHHSHREDRGRRSRKDSHQVEEGGEEA